MQTVKLLDGVGAMSAIRWTPRIQHIVENIAGGELSREVIVPLLPSTTLLFEGVTFTVPKRGEKLELLEFSRKSARIYRAEQLKNFEIKNPERYTERLMNAVQKELRLDRQPRHIECFDNSNLQGAHPVASCVVFRDGKPSRKEYRHFNIKTMTGADDYASMREVVFRRYTRLMAEGAEMPDLIIADGGKGQMGVIHEVLERLGLDIPIAGLVKDDRHRTAELLCGFPPVLVGIRPTSPLFHFWRTFRRRCTVSPFPSTGRNAARRLSTANWSRSRGSGTRRSRPCCAISARWKRSVRPTSKNFRRWSAAKAAIRAFFEK